MQGTIVLPATPDRRLRFRNPSAVQDRDLIAKPPSGLGAGPRRRSGPPWRGRTRGFHRCRDLRGVWLSFVALRGTGVSPVRAALDRGSPSAWPRRPCHARRGHKRKPHPICRPVRSCGGNPFGVSPRVRRVGLRSRKAAVRRDRRRKRSSVPCPLPDAARIGRGMHINRPIMPMTRPRAQGA
jgi:hypothetical protein